jgi:hypothetical protein
MSTDSSTIYPRTQAGTLSRFMDKKAGVVQAAPPAQPQKSLSARNQNPNSSAAPAPVVQPSTASSFMAWLTGDTTYRNSNASPSAQNMENTVSRALQLSGSSDLGVGGSDFSPANVLRQFVASEIMTTLSMTRVQTTVFAADGAQVQWTTPEQYFVSPVSLMYIAEIGRNTQANAIGPVTLNWDSTGTLQGFLTATGNMVTYNPPPMTIGLFLFAKPYNILNGQSTYTINYNGIARNNSLNPNSSMSRAVFPIVCPTYTANLAHNLTLSGINGVVTDIINYVPFTNMYTAYTNIDPNFNSTSPKWDNTLPNSAITFNGNNISLQVIPIFPNPVLSILIDEIIAGKYTPNLAEMLLIGYCQSGLGGGIVPAPGTIISLAGSGKSASQF